MLDTASFESASQQSGVDIDEFIPICCGKKMMPFPGSVQAYSCTNCNAIHTIGERATRRYRRYFGDA